MSSTAGPYAPFFPATRTRLASVTNVFLAQAFDPGFALGRYHLGVGSEGEKSVTLSTLSFALTCTLDQPVSHETTGYQPYVRHSR